MKICFYGVGGVGGYFGTLLANKYQDEHEIYFIARGRHKDAICTNGLTLKKDGGNDLIKVSPKICTDNVEDLPVCDIIILSVKGYDLGNAVSCISKITNENTVILPLLNGVDIYERIRSAISIGIILPSCVYVGTHIESPGIIYQKGGSCKISLGKDPAFPDFYPELLLKLFKNAKINFDWEENISSPIWSKFMFIAAFGLVTATYNKTLGEVLKDIILTNSVKGIMGEIEEIANSLNVPLPSDIIETSYFKAKQFPPETKTSFQRDVESKGNLNEGDLFGGTLIRFGEKLNIPTPETRDVYNKLLRRLR